MIAWFAAPGPQSWAIRWAGDRLRVKVQLIENVSSTILLSRRYDRELHDVCDIQDDIANDIITETEVVLTEGEAARLGMHNTRSVRAWEYFHQGLVEHLKYAPDANRAARRLFRLALAEDPDYSDPLFADGWASWIAARSSYGPYPDADLHSCRAAIDALIAQ